MHKKYSADGFVAVSVSFDNAENKEDLSKVNRFLERKNAVGMTNLIAKDNPIAWYEKDKLGAEALPLVFVFDRQNRRVKKLEGDKVNYDTIEAEVAKLLKQK